MRKLYKKIISMVMILLMLVSSFQSFVFASTEISSANLVKIQESELHLEYWSGSSWNYVKTNYIGYIENGTTYPAYCLNRELPGVDEMGSYTVNITEVLSDVRVWRTIINGFPYKTALEIGCETDLDAYQATKQAVYSILYDRDPSTFYRGGDTRGNKIADAIVNLTNIGRYGSQTQVNASVSMNKVGNFVEDGNYYSQRYNVTSFVTMGSFEVVSTNNLPNASYIADINGNEKTNFSAGENFKVMIPKDKLASNVDIDISIQAKCKTYPVFYGNSPNNGWQNYAVTYDPFGDESAVTNFNISTNTGKLQIIKVDEETSVGIEGVTFELKKENGEKVASVTTNANGIATFSNLYQDNYILNEVGTDEHYIINDKDFNVSIEYNKQTDITITNLHKKGNLKITKVDLNEPNITLGGVEFDLLDSKGKFVQKLITDANGEIYLKDINTGDYVLKETLTNRLYEISVDVGTNVAWKETTNLTVTNEKKKGQIRVIKVDMDNNEVKLKGVTFEVLDSKNRVIEELITDENGIAITSRLVLGDYKIREKSTLEEYVLSDEIKTITLEQNQIKDITFENEKIKGQIQITKLSSQDNKYSELPKGSLLEGAIFEIYDSNNNLVERVTTGEDGKAVSKVLLKGIYHIKETSSPFYYLLNKNTFDAEIVEHNKIIDVAVENDSVDINITIEKTGFIETQSKDTIYYNFKNIKNNSNVYLDNFTWQDTLPVDALRIDKIYTGTWNQDLQYEIWYKTNLNDYKLFKEDLSTQTIYEVNFNEIQLAEDEYITEYEFRFARVDIGFSEVEYPILYCKMLDGLKNGYVFINNTKVSGTYFDKYVEAKDKWKTITYYKEINITKKLPKTGF